MPDYTVRISTAGRLDRSEVALGPVAQTLGADDRISGIETGLDVTSGALFASFRIQERAMGRAIEVGVELFYHGLAGAGYATDRPGWRLLVDAEVADDA